MTIRIFLPPILLLYRESLNAIHLIIATVNDFHFAYDEPFFVNVTVDELTSNKELLVVNLLLLSFCLIVNKVINSFEVTFCLELSGSSAFVLRKREKMNLIELLHKKSCKLPDCCNFRFY